jgi:hypothetical protein
MDSIEFNNLFFIKSFFNYMIKINGHIIEHQPKNKNLFKTEITLNKAKINKSCSLFPNQSNIEG